MEEHLVTFEEMEGKDEQEGLQTLGDTVSTATEARAAGKMSGGAILRTCDHVLPSNPSRTQPPPAFFALSYVFTLTSPSPIRMLLWCNLVCRVRERSEWMGQKR
jgi:hypothetical protein